MEKNGQGSIVLFSSMYGSVSPDPREAPMNVNPVEYGVGKAGIVQMTRYLAIHWAKEASGANIYHRDFFQARQLRKKILSLLNVWLTRFQWDGWAGSHPKIALMNKDVKRSVM